jgi:hypothetical protein
MLLILLLLLLFIRYAQGEIVKSFKYNNIQGLGFIKEHSATVYALERNICEKSEKGETS